jgi:four helix bundle protein
VEERMVEKTTIESYKNLIAWRKGLKLCIDVYNRTKAFPQDERYGLKAELRKTARSVVYNIAEGQRRSPIAEYLRYLDIARGSQGELETQIILAGELGYFSRESRQQLQGLCDEMGRILYSLIRSLRRTKRS